ncbi:hypothetical protein [Mucilaginibacter segetis]|uniref:Four helix bundle protein n=1 Tax=Mucilaginibacter segetis TaxID=2793071 RepID=A0A934UMX3_9SPHI|nr:hypothetical protein [Mucilaginibacter segetis]
MKICRKESKESQLWLKLIDVDEGIENARMNLLQEATELTRIFGAIIEKMKVNKS